jgi:hypothetical protein
MLLWEDESERKISKKNQTETSHKREVFLLFFNIILVGRKKEIRSLSRFQSEALVEKGKGVVMAERQVIYWAAENDQIGKWALAVAKRADAKTRIWSPKSKQLFPPIYHTDVVFFGLPETICWGINVRMVAYMHAPTWASTKTPFLIGVSLQDPLRTEHAVLDAMRQLELFHAGERLYPVPMVRTHSKNPSYQKWLQRIQAARHEVREYTWSRSNATALMRGVNAQIRKEIGGPKLYQSSSSNIRLS